MPESVQTLPVSRNWRPLIALVIGVFAVSTAAIFIRLAQAEGAPSLVLAAARLVVASAVLTPLVLKRRWQELRAVDRSDLMWMLVGGIVLGLHFATWITSLEYTAVVNSVVLVTTSPLWVALMAPFLLKEKIGRWIILGLMVALGGGLLVGLSGEVGDPPKQHDPLLGNGLALIGAVMAAVYYVIGRRLRVHLDFILYVWLVYSVGAVILIVTVVVSRQQVFGLSGETYLWMLLMGLVPQLIGHSSFNFALGYLPVAYVSLVTLAEPIGSGLLAIAFLDEWPVMMQLIGSILILIGIVIASRDRGEIK
jgi:drug/metabolite transporter (DMT)-like permease